MKSVVSIAVYSTNEIKRLDQQQAANERARLFRAADVIVKTHACTCTADVIPKIPAINKRRTELCLAYAAWLPVQVAEYTGLLLRQRGVA